MHYYCALGGGHNGYRQYSDRETGGIRRMIFRPDGYTSLRAESTGEFTTLPHNLGNSMVINADIPFFSYIKIALTVPHTNEPAEGFSWEDCTLVPIDEYRYEVKWARPLSELTGPHRLRVKMYRADLYSYTLDCESEELTAEHFYKLDKPSKTK